MTSALPMIVPQPTHTRRTGRPTGQKPPLQPKEVWAIRVRLQIAGRSRDLALFNLVLQIEIRHHHFFYPRAQFEIQNRQLKSTRVAKPISIRLHFFLW